MVHHFEIGRDACIRSGRKGCWSRVACTWLTGLLRPRFLVRLLLVHGTLADYRLGRLIKYSFYKNIAFGFVLFFYQFYCGFSGQALVDDISAAAYNVVFTSLPILFFAILDRPVMRLDTLIRFPQVGRCPFCDLDGFRVVGATHRDIRVLNGVCSGSYVGGLSSCGVCISVCMCI